MPEALKDLLDKRMNRVEQARAILSEAGDGELAADKRKQYDEIDKEIDTLTASIEGLKGDARRKEKLKSLEERLAAEGVERRTEPTQLNIINDDRKLKPFATDAYNSDFRKFLRTGIVSQQMESLSLQSDADTAGGYLVSAEQFVMEMIKELDDEVIIRKLARRFVVPKAKSLGAPKRTSKASTFGWSSELQVSAADTSLKFGKRNLHPHHLTGEIDISRDLLNSALTGPEEIVREEMARDAGEVQEEAFMAGTGVDQPLGIFTASAEGISTARDSATGSATDLTADGLIDAFYKLKKAYRRRAEWLMHREGIKRARKLKGSDNNYLWQPGLQAGEPDLLLGRPLNDSEFCPSTFTTGLYVGMFADFSYYWIVDALDMEIQRLEELLARSNQIGFIGRLKCDGAPILEEAFVRLKTN